MASPRLVFVFGLGLLFLAACSGPSQTGDETGPAPDVDAVEEAGPALAEVETFDVSTYPTRPPQQTVEVKHEVPFRLMQGRATEGVEQTVEGFRVQVFSAQDQEAAQEFRERVRQWWEQTESRAPDDLFRSSPPIVIEYSQPYYRVRIGAFADREEAEEALEFVQNEYAGAFVARSTVTVIQ